MMYNLYAVMLNNLMQIQLHRALGPYELALYQQLLVTVKQRSRLDELVLQRAIEDMKNGKGSNQASGGTTQPDPQTKEHRGDGPSPTV